MALLIEHLRRVYEVKPKIDGRIKIFQSQQISNSSFSPPLLFGEPASEYNKIDGVFVVQLDKKTSEADEEDKENSLSVIDEIAEMKNDKEYENKSSFAMKEQLGRKNSSFTSETSVKRLKRTGKKTNIENNDWMKELPKYTNVDLKENRETMEIRENDIDNLNSLGSNGHDIATDTKHKETDEKDSFNQAYLSNISSNLFSESKKITETSDDSLDQEAKVFKIVGEDIDEVSKNNENASMHLSKENIHSNNPETFKNETKISISKISELLKVLLDRSSEISSSSYNNISKNFPDLPGISEFLEKVSRNLTKLFLKYWLDDNGNIKNYSEFQNNISSFLENLEKCLRRNLYANSSDSLSDEKVENSTENLKIFQLMKALVNTSSSFGNNSQKHLDVPGSSYFFEKISHNWLDDNETVKNNTSSFLGNLDSCLRSISPLNWPGSVTNEMQRNSTESK